MLKIVTFWTFFKKKAFKLYMKCTFYYASFVLLYLPHFREKIKKIQRKKKEGTGIELATELQVPLFIYKKNTKKGHVYL